jgi:transposase
MAQFTMTVLGQLLDILPRAHFERLTGQHQGDHRVRKLTCWQQLTILLYAQITEKDSLRDIESGLLIQHQNWYHLGVETVARSTLAKANEKRSSKIFESLFYSFLQECLHFSTDTAKKFSFDNPLYAIDSTTIRLCLALFPWAKFRKRKGAIKLHVLLNIRSQIPELITISTGKKADITAARQIDLTLLPDGSILVMDRGYVDYEFLYKIHKSKKTFVVRLKENAQIVRLEQRAISEEERVAGVQKDERIAFVLPDAIEHYPEDLRLVTYYDGEHDVTYEFLTNNMDLSAKTVADIYKARWHIELFFRWIKQHLKIKTFLGTSENAVMIQIWVAMLYYLMLAWLKHQTHFRGTLLDLSRMIREVPLERISIINLLHLTPQNVSQIAKKPDSGQCCLFGA